MQEILTKLEQRRKYLKRIRTEKIRALETAPEGVLRITKKGTFTQYYVKSENGPIRQKYLRKKDLAMAKELAQKSYDNKLVRCIDEEVAAIDSFLKKYPAWVAEELMKNISVERAKMIEPIVKSDEDYIAEWRAFEYCGKGFDGNAPELLTARDERVRSKSELMIANALNERGIPYRYECPLKMPGVSSIYPDFTVLKMNGREEILWEHFGMMDNPEYAEKAIWKIRLYEKNGYYQGRNLVITYETQKNILTTQAVNGIIDEYFG